MGTMICSRCPSLQYLSAPVDGAQDPALAQIVTNVMARRWRNLRRLNLAYGATDAGLVAMTSQCKNLENLNCPLMHGKDMVALASACPRLAHIAIYQEYAETEGLDQEVRDDAVEALARACPELRDVSLRETRATDASILVLAESCPQLR